MALGKLGAYTTCAAADLADATHAVNLLTDTRIGSGGIGKHAGAAVLVAGASNVHKMYIATGSTATAPWAPVDGGAVVTPS